MQSHCEQIAISWHEARNRSTCRLPHCFFTGVRRVSSKRAVNNKTNERRSPRSTMLLFRSTPRAKQVERDISHDARTAADTARSSHAWIRACRQLRMCTPKRGRQVHEALGVFLCESLAKHGERCRIWEAERCSTAERFALGVGRTRVRDEAEPLHDEALSGGGAIFFGRGHE